MEQAKPDNGMAVGNVEARRLAKAITDIEERMKSSTVIITIRALSRKRWAELVAAHPPRDGVEDDTTFGVNVSTFVDVALAESIEGAVRADDGTQLDFTGKDWPEVAAEISNAQWQQFLFDLFRVNNLVTVGPTSGAASLVMRSSETSSAQPAS